MTQNLWLVCPAKFICLFAGAANRLYFTARPMEDGLAEAIDEGKIGPRDDPKARSKILADEYGWDKDLAKKIWCAALPVSPSSK